MCINCDECGGELVFLGTLGHLQHFKCQDCGIQQADEITDEELVAELFGPDDDDCEDFEDDDCYVDAINTII